ncbi:hypothetical protein ACFROC_35530, partial [Nocardia tengchongensis]|uniref:hypothetical protein n=1 Tax=Nocardia tengchongensis TaxID=2055889 RepID=UPI0036A3F0ED
RYTDRPGVVGTLGRILGESEINIAGMQVARAEVNFAVGARPGGDFPTSSGRAPYVVSRRRSR